MGDGNNFDAFVRDAAAGLANGLTFGALPRDGFVSEFLGTAAAGAAGAALGGGVGRVLERNVAPKLIQKEGDNQREVREVGPPNPEPPQQWLMIMNIATDFGGECTIEKRTKKLQELAEKTRGSDATIIVQTTSRDKPGDPYKLERFVMRNGRITKLESPGNSNGYGEDLEKLVKDAMKTYPAHKVGLILDSHGEGNEGLTGDNGTLSITDFRDRMQRALKGTGHDKLDFLQFDCCLMAQNGVLDTTAGIARHVVGSADPQGVTAETCAADNPNLEALLKKPSMSAGDLADICVANARGVKGFDTMTHFDMSKYNDLRTALDTFGEQLVKASKNPDNMAVIRRIIADTHNYNTGISFRLGNIGGMIEGLFRPKPLFDPPKPFYDPARPKPLYKPDQPGVPPLYKPEFLNEPSYGYRPDYGGRPYYDKPDQFFARGGAKRDLKQFADKVLEAIGKGLIKDEDGKLREAAEKLLQARIAVTRSTFIRNDPGLGGLSVYLPTTPGDQGNILAANGGWSQFQNRLRAELEGQKPKVAGVPQRQR